MRDLPTGTLTFLFTDVEGSTKLLHELGAEEYAEALAERCGARSPARGAGIFAGWKPSRAQPLAQNPCK
jgi:hypothetical protein